MSLSTVGSTKLAPDQLHTALPHPAGYDASGTHYMNLVAMLVPHGRLSRIGFSNTLPHITSSPFRSFVNFPRLISAQAPDSS